MIGYSKERPAMFWRRNGQVLFRYNIEAVQVQTPEGEETQYRFEQAVRPVWPDKSIGGAKALLAEIVADKRWAKEIGGIQWGGHAIHTDRESQSKIIAAYVASRDGVRSEPSQWKTQGGFVTITNADVIDLALAVQAHIQACYDSEKTMVEQIDGCGTLEELERLNIAV